MNLQTKIQIAKITTAATLSFFTLFLFQLQGSPGLTRARPCTSPELQHGQPWKAAEIPDFCSKTLMLSPGLLTLFFTQRPALTSLSVRSTELGGCWATKKITHLKVGIELSVPNLYHRCSLGQGLQPSRAIRRTHVLPVHTGRGLEPAPVGPGEAEAAGEKWEQTREHHCCCSNAVAVRTSIFHGTCRPLGRAPWLPLQRQLEHPVSAAGLPGPHTARHSAHHSPELL